MSDAILEELRWNLHCLRQVRESAQAVDAENRAALHAHDTDTALAVEKGDTPPAGNRGVLALLAEASSGRLAELDREIGALDVELGIFARSRRATKLPKSWMPAPPSPTLPIETAPLASSPQPNRAAHRGRATG